MAALVGCKFADLPPIDETGDGGVGIDADLNVSQPLTVALAGAGAGSVTSDPAGIDCGSTCTADFDPLAMVTLTATPMVTSTFEGWSGDCSGMSTCTVTMDGAKNVTATFALHGAVRWVNQISFVENDSIDAIAVDAQGNVIVAGAVEPAGERDLFVAKYAPATGQVIWMRHFATLSANGGYESSFGGMTVDAAGDVYVATSLQGNGTADGAVAWVKQWGGTSVDIPKALAVSGGELYVTGTTSSNPSSFDAFTITGQSNQAFILRASTATGNVAQVRTIPGAYVSIAADGNNILLGGSMNTGTLNEPGCTGTSASGTGTDGLLMMIAGSSLGCQWLKSFGSNTSGDDASVSSVAAFDGGGWAVVGQFEGSLSGLSAGSLGSMGMFDVFVARFALDGTHQWSFRYGNAATEFSGGISTTPQGNVIFAGSFTGELNFGPHTVMGTNNAFVTRMSSAQVPTHEWAVSLGGAEADSARDVAVASDGTSFVTASFSGMTTVGTTSLASQTIDHWVASLVR